MAAGVVYLIGAGPGDAGLLTLRGAELLGRADAVVYDGLVSASVLDLCRPDAERFYAGKKHAAHGAPLSQREINHLLVDLARQGKLVVRLKGGDPFVFGRGAEECQVLADAGIRFEIVPGVTAATAVPAYAGIPLTARGVTATVAFATGHETDEKEPGAGAVDWPGLARAGTIVLFMALRSADECCRELIAAGRAADTPAAAVTWGTRPEQRTLVATLGTLGAALAEAGFGPPALLIIGDVVRLRQPLAWAEARPLHGVRALATRAAGEGGGFGRAVAELGGEPLFLPVTRRVAIDDDAARLRAALADLSRFDWIAFASGHAVDRFFAALHRSGRDARALGALRLACVGKATAAALGRHGLRADVVSTGDAAKMAADLAATARPGGARVLLPRAAGGRDEAMLLLRALGVAVEPVALYRSEPTPADDPQLGPGLGLLRRGQIHAVAVFAPSQARALVGLLGADAPAVLARVATVAAIGETTRRALAALGVRVDVVPPSAEAGALAAALVRR